MKNTKDYPTNLPIDRFQFDEDDEGTKFSDFYIPLEILGSGSFGTCVSARDLSNKQIYAVKIIPKKKLQEIKEYDILSEAKILWQLNHPNIVKFINVIETDTKVLVVTELMKGGSLKKFMAERKANSQPLKDEEAATIMKNIISALHYMHNRGIVHRDLKPENILLGDSSDLNSVKICDFGLSGQFENAHEMYNVHTFAEICGTRIYMAPEIFENKSYGKAVDIWSAGIIQYMLLAQGQHPIYRPGDTSDKYEEKLFNNSWDVFPSSFDKHSRHLFLHLVDRQPHNRYTAGQILSHPWITRCFDKEAPKTLSESLGIYSNTQNLQRVREINICLTFKIMKVLYIMVKADFLKEKPKRPSPILRKDSNLTNDVLESQEDSPANRFGSENSTENDPGVGNRKLSILSEGEIPKTRFKALKLIKKPELKLKTKTEGKTDGRAESGSLAQTFSASKLKSTLTGLNPKVSVASTAATTLNSLPDEPSEIKKKPPKPPIKLNNFPSLPILDHQTEESRLPERITKPIVHRQALNTNPNTPRGGKSGPDSFKNLNNRRFREMLAANEEASQRVDGKNASVMEATKNKTPVKLRPVRDLSKNDKQSSKFQFNQDEYLFGPKSSGRGGNSTHVKSPVNRMNISPNVQVFGKVA